MTGGEEFLAEAGVLGTERGTNPVWGAWGAAAGRGEGALTRRVMRGEESGRASRDRRAGGAGAAPGELAAVAAT